MKNVEFLSDLKVCRYWLYELVTNLTNNLEYNDQYQQAKHSHGEKINDLIFLIEEANCGMEATIAAIEKINRGIKLLDQFKQVSTIRMMIKKRQCKHQNWNVMRMVWVYLEEMTYAWHISS